MSNGGMIAGAFSSTSGKADITLTTNGDILYYNSGRQRLPKGSDDEILTLASGLPSWAAAAGGGGLLSVLGTYEAESAEATHTFTFTAVDFEDDSLLILEFDGNASAIMAITIRINGESGSVYLTDGTTVAGGTQVILDDNNDTSGSLWTAATQSDGGRAFAIVANISLSTGGNSDNYPEILSRACMWDGVQTSRVNVSAGETSITSVEILSSDNWEIGARATLYKLARA